MSKVLKLLLSLAELLWLNETEKYNDETKQKQTNTKGFFFILRILYFSKICNLPLKSRKKKVKVNH